ncbi:phosphomannomutase/phosphoglucomutase [Desulfurivibrio alkaliphilus]|uniref:Phosphomannomutase n=1 Tax=Desulfurivibrio alkaliphilus (strain DSM 19089 / UNIQEM U267 / AHT2) TaxID=589865 RepID=D6Z4E9_DESAT|nr:phosphomannomutase/phosphoglucomutase [Desulfurivibrio alkaliphilus]ADH86424.1 Phosphomannomutase [Desulfurivibrio alkaliphilus AHT 2]
MAADQSPPWPVSAFKAYDIRGRVPDELNTGVARAVGRAFGEIFGPGQVVIGRDVRLTSAELSAALADGLCDGGCGVTDIGLCGTEEIYHAGFSGDFAGGIMVTASHNPQDYNGMKLVRQGARPISGESGLQAIRDLVAGGGLPAATRRGEVKSGSFREQYIRHLLSYVEPEQLQPLRVVVNAGNGCAGPVLDALAPHLPFEFVRLHHQPDGTFPHGIPNPLLPENREATAAAVREHGADVGIAWDGDFDRCFFFDETGRFIEGYYLVGLLAEAFLARHPGARIIHDPRLTWNTIEVVERAGGVPVMSKTGHAFIKERMRIEDAVYGGEMSAHHYFRDFAYCDSGMIPWLLVLELICRRLQPLSELVGERMRLFPASGEINRRLKDPAAVLAEVERHFAPAASAVDRTDGLSMEFANWRFNLRSSNTEPVVRLNVEARADERLLQEKTAELLRLMEQPT